ncbi:MAG: hypothetical protein KF851_00595 [Pirellulaceae bacterium]|nr:hypothetical protein [Pirellulaceae bacterium]
MKNRPSQNHHRAAYSLLEIILALALAVIVVAAITAAINVFLLNLNRHQRSLEQKQVVRSVLMMMASDVRAGLQYKAIDVSGIENLSMTQELAGVLPGMGGGEGEEEAAESESGAESGTESEDSGAYRPTLVGDASTLSIDISRLPRLDQYHALLTGGDVGSETGSDVKTVSFFVSPNPPVFGMATEFEPRISALGGLYRRQIDRAVAAYNGDSGAQSLQVDQYATLLAPEIIEIRFRYFDGSDWNTSWNSEDTGGFPLAIELTVIFDPNRTALDRQFSFNDLLDLETHRLVVHLPAAEAPAEGE